MRLPRRKSAQGRNLIGPKLHEVRLSLEPKVTLEDLSGRLARLGLYIDRTSLGRIERQERSVFDFEVKALAKALRVPITLLYTE